MSAITLTLLHPGQSFPVQDWTFESQSTIRIGRGADNDVVLYSAVVSRYHLEIKHNGKDWELINLGTNGTYLNGELITKVAVEDGMIVSLANSGPKIQINLTLEESPVMGALGEMQSSDF
jgi:pSer/pThr/pTyr-binding forkhead associated (FHA) protein